ncbi:hypothetical protein GGX14DRAFT_362186 [Mycena pura]|uniref:Pentatricopeptide repeat protein n=1 Tax=Mycena pura TaxID=153505 RepID=A0AAD6YCW6_9AGAR|nr:hypothetical protein GGX14DRAFT_362186 [Mycena pura]
MLQHLQHSLPSLDPLPLPDVAVLVRTYADSPPDAADKALVELVSSLLLTRLRDLPQPRGDAVLTYKPPDIIHAAFAFVEKLLKLSEDKLALKIFQILVNSGNIPSEAVQTIPGLEGFASIVRSSLVRASTHWHWRPWAERFLSALLESSPSPSTISLTVDTIYTCLDDPTVADLRACRSLIFQIHPSSPVPNGILRQFYNAAEQIDAGEEAHGLYSFTRSEEVLKTHRYPCPRATALPWLLRYLLRINSHLAKELGEEVFVGNLPVPLQSRARIVEGLASRGHATLARGLWGKYAIGKDRETFVRDSSLMLRMVSLFHHLIKREEDVIAKMTKAGKSEIADDNFILHRQQADDFREFMDFVWSEFSQAHSPLSEASHQVLTSQARAYFIVGEFFRGFDTLKILLDRREMPDIYDINVTLTVMAQHSPRSAANIIQRMIERGLQPDHITYGTVMHHALNHGDMELVEEMVQRVRMLKNTHLSYKSIVSLVRGSIAFRPDSRITQRSKLRSVFSIIRSIGRPTVLATPHLGKYLVSASLRGDDPIMAYRFWEFLLKENALWVDREQVHLRRLVVECLQRHQKAGWVKEHHARAMIAQLRARDGVQQRSN